MSGTTDFVPFATSASANVTPQSTYVAETTTQTGYQSGVASSADCNKVWRQGTFIAAGVATFTANQLSINVADDGNLSNFVSNFTSALTSNATAAATTVVDNALASFTIPFSRVTGSIANSQVPQSAVTQYEGDLAINGSQVNGSMDLSGTLTVSGTTTLESNVTINAPANGSSLTVNGLSGYSVSQFFSASATNSVSDVAIIRSSSAANAQAAGPNLYLTDSSSGASSTFQHSGGQTEIWQSGNQLAFWNANRGLTLNAAASGNALTVNGPLYASAFDSPSDARLKTDIRPIESARAKVRRIRGVFFKWKSTGEDSAGVIAQEVREVFPEAVKEQEDGTLSVNPLPLIGLLFAALGEQDDQR